jgi:hypothetical protein
MKPSPAELSLIGQIAANKRWANTEDRAAATLPARRGFLDKLEREADPNNELLPAERAKRAENLRKAHYARMALNSARARRRRAN